MLHVQCDDATFVDYMKEPESNLFPKSNYQNVVAIKLAFLKLALILVLNQ